MKQVTFKSISLQGFKSYSNSVSFKFANTGLHLIRGANGDGKTSLFSALVWCLYKVNLNNTANTKIPTFKHKRTAEYKGTRVQILFGIGRYKYLVARHMDFKGTTKGLDGNDSLLIFRKKKVDKTPITSADVVNDQLYKDDQQAYLNMLLGIDAKTFLNSVVFGQRMSRLMESKDADKRDLFERLFDVDFIDDLKQKAAKKQSDASSILRQLQQEQLLLIQRQALLQEQLISAENIVSEFKTRRKATLAGIKQQHEAAKATVTTVDAQIVAAERKQAKSGNKASMLTTLLEEVDANRETYYDAKETCKRLQRDISIREEDIAQSVSKQDKQWEQLKNVKDTCPTCNGKLDAKQVLSTKKKIEESITQEAAVMNSLKGGLVNMQSTLAKAEIKLTSALELFTSSNESYEDAKANSNPSNSNEILALQQKKVLTLATIKQLVAAYNTEKERPVPTVNIPQINSELASVESTLPDLAKAIKVKTNYIARLDWWQSKAFNAGGLKSFIFSASLNKLNECTATYTTYFGISIIFGIDLTKASKPFFCKVTLDGKNEVDYDSLSGGEKQKADLSICFGLQDAAEAVSCFNIVVLDEPEGNLDTEVLEVFDMLLRIRAESKAVYVISHNNQMDLAGAQVFHVSGGKSGISTIE